MAKIITKNDLLKKDINGLLNFYGDFSRCKPLYQIAFFLGCACVALNQENHQLYLRQFLIHGMYEIKNMEKLVALYDQLLKYVDSHPLTKVFTDEAAKYIDKIEPQENWSPVWAHYHVGLSLPLFGLELVGSKEVLDMLRETEPDLTKQALSNRVKRGSFPEPYSRIAATPLWLREQIKQYIQSR